MTGLLAKGNCGTREGLWGGSRRQNPDLRHTKRMKAARGGRGRQGSFTIVGSGREYPEIRGQRAPHCRG